MTYLRIKSIFTFWMSIYNIYIYGSCQLCNGTFTNGTEVVIYKCKHKYHKSCFIKQKLSLYPPLCNWCKNNTNKRENNYMYYKNYKLVFDLGLDYKKMVWKMVMGFCGLKIIYVFVKNTDK